MRKIKFRAYLKSAQKMVRVTGFDFDDKYGEWEYEQDGEYCTIAEEFIELMQYTGVNDKNNKEIYEGDIVEYKNHKYFSSSGIYEISYSEGECAFVCEKSNPYNYLFPDVWSNCKIIGNIYENPELTR